MKNIINWLRFNLRFRSMSRYEAAIFNMPSTAEFIASSAEIAKGDWAVTNETVTAAQFLATEAGHDFVRANMNRYVNMQIFPLGYAKLSRTDKPADAKYLTWYIKTMEIWAARKAHELQQSIIELRDTTEKHLEYGQMRIEIDELLNREKLDFASTVIRKWKQTQTA